MDSLSAPTLNLARKWRSNNFDQIIGQDLVVRMLKNSLYLGYYFPVYLFMGQRGSGKTSMARVFAAAINCEQKAAFHKDPKKASIPCLTCVACKEIKNGTHPDFIEIDAASHTGVDNVRQIIESASFMPVMGTKKIYLIDEAHMLSKAAFNALLKILEEPPLSVIFILATTDPQKIIDTVKSRCFQLFFKPITPAILVNHLAYICDQEKIAYQKEGLILIAHESEGSVRDAQNIIEQVRFTGQSITKETVLEVLGYLDDEQVIILLNTALYKTPADVISLIQSLQLDRYTPLYIWRRLQDLMRAVIWHTYTGSADFFPSSDTLLMFVERCSLLDIHRAVEIFYHKEYLFLKTTAQHALLELILLQLNTSNDIAPEVKKKVIKASESSKVPEIAAHSVVQEIPVEMVPFIPKPASSEWDTFLQKIETVLVDQLVISLFKQAQITIDLDKQIIIGSFTQDMSFFIDLLEQTSAQWHPILTSIFGSGIRFVPLFDREKKVLSSSFKNSLKNSSPVVPQKIEPVKIIPSKGEYKPRQALSLHRISGIGKKIDVSDINRWPQTNLVLTYFSGIVTQIEEAPETVVHTITSDHIQDLSIKEHFDQGE